MSTLVVIMTIGDRMTLLIIVLNDNDDDTRHCVSLVMPRRNVIIDVLQRHFFLILYNLLMMLPLVVNGLSLFILSFDY